MGRTALYRDPAPFRPARAEVQLDGAVLLLRMPDGRQRRLGLDGCSATQIDGFVARADVRRERRFVRMLILERDHDRHVIITPPDHGAVAPSVVRLPEAPAEAAILDDHEFDPLADWILGGGRLAGCSIADLARLAAIATPEFAELVGEVAAQRALELVRAASGPLRGIDDIEAALAPLALAARHSPRADEALIAALAHASGTPGTPHRPARRLSEASEPPRRSLLWWIRAVVTRIAAAAQAEPRRPVAGPGAHATRAEVANRSAAR
jgi:hypothetical protein